MYIRFPVFDATESSGGGIRSLGDRRDLEVLDDAPATP